MADRLDALLREVGWDAFPDGMREAVQTAPGSVLFGYCTVTGVPTCPCKDPGTYMMCEQGDGPLDFLLRCWCGRTMRGEWDDWQERLDFIGRHTGRTRQEESGG